MNSPADHSDRGPAHPSGSDAEISGPEEEELPEFSLEILGAAYARVLRGEDPAGAAPVPGDDESMDSAEPGDSAAPAAEAVGLEDEEDDRGCPINEESVLEAVLFVGAPEGTRLTARRLAALMRDVSPREIPALVRRLNDRYERDQSAWRVVQADGGWQMELIPELAGLRTAFLGEARPARLAQSAVDVLAIVAYHQPISRVEVERIWQRPCGAVLSQLSQRNLLALTPDSGPIRDRKFITTDRFLQLLGLESIDDLPRTAELDELDDMLDG